MTGDRVLPTVSEFKRCLESLATARAHFEEHVDQVDRATKWTKTSRTSEGTVARSVNLQTEPDCQFRRAMALLSRLGKIESDFAELISDLDAYGLFNP